MKVTTILIFAFLMQVSAAGLAQKITLNERNASLESVMDKIRSQTGYEFVFNVKDIDNAKRVNVSFNAKELNEALEELFEDQALSFSVKDRFIVVKPKEKSFIDKLVGILDNNSHADIDIKGKVVNENNETLPGALIKIKGTNRAVIADAKGNFELYKVDDKSILVVSYIGYETQEVKAAPSMGYITLKPTTNALDQVVVQGYGTTTDRLRTGNIATVTKEIIEKQPVSNVLQALQGRVPGLIVTQQGGYDSAPFKVELRGRSAINPNLVSEPLFVIDGVPYDNLDNANEVNLSVTGTLGLSGPAGGQSPLFNINPKDIESISVLKDADALAIYGSKGANGVVLITTKKGQSGKTKFDTEVHHGINMVTKRYEMLNTQQYVAMRKEAFKNSRITPNSGNAYDIMAWDTTRYSDLQKLYWGDAARRLEVQVGLSGGEKGTTFRLNGSFLNSNDLNTYSGGNNRIGLQFNLNHKNLNQKLNISLNGFYTNTSVDLITLSGSITSPPNIPAIFDDQGRLNYSGFAPARFEFRFGGLLRPYAAKTSMLNSNLKIQYQLAKGLNVSTSMGYSTTKGDQIFTTPIISQDPMDNPTGGSDFGKNTQNSFIIEPQADYKLSIGNGELSALIGATFQAVNKESTLLRGTGYVNDNLLKSISSAPIVRATDKLAEYRYSGIFARINYNYQNKYIVNFSARRDGSTRFGPGKQFGNFGSAGVAWIFTEETWFKDLEILSFGKLRASYGVTGSDNIGNYQFLSSWSSSGASYHNAEPSYFVGRHFNPDLQWQVDKKVDIGLNFGLFKDRLSFDLAFYRNRVGNQLLSYPLPIITGFSEVTKNVIATVENKGYEGTLNARIIDSKKWSWSYYFNIGLNRNKLVSYPDLKESSYASRYRIGKPLGLAYTLRYTGIDTQTGEYTFEDTNGDGVLNVNPGDVSKNDMIYIKDLTEKFDGGFGTALSYNRLKLDLSFHFRNKIIKKANANIGTPGQLKRNMPIEVLDRWQKPGDNAKYARFTVTPNDSDYNYEFSDAVYTDMYFIRLNNAVLSYSLPEKWLKKLGARSASVYASGQNLLTFTNFEGLDPEFPAFGNRPSYTTVVAGLQLTF